jgi:hypothetical protein
MPDDVPIMDTPAFANVWWNQKKPAPPTLPEQIAKAFTAALETMARAVTSIQNTTQDDFALAGPSKGGHS